MSIDGGDFYDWHTSTPSSFTWYNVGKSWVIGAGEHTLKI